MPTKNTISHLMRVRFAERFQHQPVHTDIRFISQAVTNLHCLPFRDNQFRSLWNPQTTVSPASVWMDTTYLGYHLHLWQFWYSASCGSVVNSIVASRLWGKLDRVPGWHLNERDIYHNARFYPFRIR